MATLDESTPQAENRHHDYVGNDIPWYVRAIWVGFWIFTAVYILRYLFPAMQRELFQP